MHYIHGFTIHKQDGSLSCWAACARSVLDYYASDDGLTQKEFVSLFGNGNLAGKPERILKEAGALRNVESFEGDDEATKNAPRLFLRIMDSISRFEPEVVSLRQAGIYSTIGHALVIYGYDSNYRVAMKDPARPNTDIEADLREMLLSFAPYGDIVEFRSLRYYVGSLIFTQKPPSWRSRRVALRGLYRGFTQ
jgi:hypothetical protein